MDTTACRADARAAQRRPVREETSHTHTSPSVVSAITCTEEEEEEEEEEEDGEVV
jgi:hypothetical protein